ncbi:MAG: hypothetical protein OXC53_05945, partial [Rhodobacteraceae bacterium]|nr:hypothetical protein [Paracoccaceae bacterium]
PENIASLDDNCVHLVASHSVVCPVIVVAAQRPRLLPPAFDICSEGGLQPRIGLRLRWLGLRGFDG